jgi:hypothetical protein
MARIPGVEAAQAGWLVRFIYWMTKRKVGRVILPVKIMAHHPRILRGIGSMEMAQEAAQTVDARLKCLVQVKAAQRIGCPF